MSRYDDIVALGRASPSAAFRTPMREAEVAALAKKYPQIPADYVDYLREVGWGPIGNSTYVIYQTLMNADAIYDDEPAKELSHILFFGDNFAGYCGGFDTRRGCAVVEINPADMSCVDAGKSFEDFVKALHRRLGGH